MQEFIVFKEDVDKVEMFVHNALFQEALRQGQNPMVAIYPTRGLYMASSMTREFNKTNAPAQNMKSYFYKMPMGDYFSLAATIRLMSREGADMGEKEYVR